MDLFAFRVLDSGFWVLGFSFSIFRFLHFSPLGLWPFNSGRGLQEQKQSRVLRSEITFS